MPSSLYARPATGWADRFTAPTRTITVATVMPSTPVIPTAYYIPWRPASVGVKAVGGAKSMLFAHLANLAAIELADPIMGKRWGWLKCGYAGWTKGRLTYTISCLLVEVFSSLSQLIPNKLPRRLAAVLAASHLTVNQCPPSFTDSSRSS